MGFDLGEEFGSNERAEIEGVWVSLGEDAGVKVARLGNPEAQRAYRKIPRAVRRSIEEGSMGNKQAVQFLAKFMAEHILKDWKGLSLKGKSLPAYTSEVGKKHMEEFRRFRDRIWEISVDDDLYNVEVEEDVKNLHKVSSGS
jgi:hypothetical protein